VKPGERRFVRGCWIVGWIVLILLALADLAVHHHPHFSEGTGFRADGRPFFYSLYGFLSGVAVVVVARKVIFPLFGRPEDYYEREEERAREEEAEP